MEGAEDEELDESEEELILDSHQVEAWVRDATRFVPPENEYYPGGAIKTVSDERKAISDEDIRGVVAKFPGLVEMSLRGCEQLTDSSIVEIAKRRPELQSLVVRCAPRLVPSRRSVEPPRPPPRAGTATS